MSGSIKHPSVYIFFGENDADAVLRELEKTHPPGGFFYIAGISHGGDNRVRELKARIQSGESGLSIKRVNIYLVVNTDKENAGDVINISRKLHNSFLEDFTTVILTLIVLLKESNDFDGSENSLNEYEIRNAATSEFLTVVSEPESTDIYDRIYLLCDRNEHDIVNLANREKLYTLIASLPFLHNVPSRFSETLNAKSGERGRGLFASAGIWRHEQPEPQDILHDITAVHALRNLALVMEQNLDAGARENFNRSSTVELIEEASSKAVLPDEIISNVSSVAARPFRIWELWGHSVKTAEFMLYGAEAARFYTRWYEPEELQINAVADDLPEGLSDDTDENTQDPTESASDPTESASDPTESASDPPKSASDPPKSTSKDASVHWPLTMTLREAVSFERYLHETLSDINNEKDIIAAAKKHLENEQIRMTGISSSKHFKIVQAISARVSEIHKKPPFPLGLMQGVDYVKTAIGECYALRYEQNRLRIASAKYKAEHSRLASYLEYIRQVVFQLKNLEIPKKEALETEPSYLFANGERLAPLAVSLMRDDGLLREQHLFSRADDKPIFIRLIGGFAPEDLTRWKAINSTNR